MIRKFLVADDDPDDTDLFGEALSSIDVSIEFNCVNNGKELIENLKSGKFTEPHVIFLDINMPEMNGWECLKNLKKEKEFKDIPVIMYSTSSSVSDGRKAVSFGALGLYEKPPSFLLLQKFLESISSATDLKRRLKEIEADKSHKVYSG